MTYQQTLDWMFSRLPMFQRQGSTAFKKDLTNIKVFCELLHQPQNKYPAIHVAGTNGKGSTSHMLASILQEAGYKVGLYTSPHLKDFRERIKVDGTLIDELSVVHFIKTYKSFLEERQLSFFELTVGMAFDYFAKTEVDIAIIEVGLGGRLDSTNIINPLISVITNIGLDHTQYLGETMKEIAFEKGGIIKPNTPVVIGEYQKEVIEVFEELSQNAQAPVFLAEELVQDTYETDLKGLYQLKNLKTAVQAIRLMNQMNYKISEDDIILGLKNVSKNTGLKGRWQIIQNKPKVVCDTAHNKEGLKMVMSQLKNENYNKLHFVLGVVNDKDLKDILSLLPKKALYYFCKPDIPRGLAAGILKEAALTFDLEGEVYESVSEAYTLAMQNASVDDFIYVGGSTFVVAELDL